MLYNVADINRPGRLPATVTHMPMRRGVFLTGAIVSLLSLGWAGTAVVRAQEPTLPPEAAGPSAQELQSFESQFGAPPSDFAPSIAAPVVEREEPGKVPDSVKKYVTDADILPIYCAYTRWKTGRFLSAMDAVKKELGPAMDKVKALGVDVAMPDSDGLKAEAERRIEAICAAKTVADAESQIADFEAWGAGSAAKPFDGLKDAVQSGLQAKGDELRAKIKAEIDPYVQSEKTRIESELKRQAQSLAESKKAELESSGTPPTPERLEAIKADLESQIKASADREKADLQKNLKAKVDALIGDTKDRFDEVKTAFDGMQSRIDADVAADAGQYDRYRTEALTLRKTVTLAIVDKSMTDQLGELDAAAADLADAKKQDPSIKSADEIKASLAEDRRGLEAALDAALAKGDDSAFEDAMVAYRTKWESYRSEAEKAVSGSVDKVCGVVATQFGQAKPQLSSGLSQVDALLGECATDSSERCLKVNEFAPRLGTLKQKISDIQLSMGVAEGMCADESKTDVKELGALLRKIQSDAEDLKSYGEALQADKGKVLAQTIKEICDQALPQLDAAEREIAGNDMAAISAETSRCTGQAPSGLADFCAKAKAVTADRADLAKRVDAFTGKIAAVRKLCSGAMDETSIESLGAALSSLKAEGDDLRSRATDLRAEVDSGLSEKVFCRSAKSLLDQARSDAGGGIQAMTDGLANCTAKDAAGSDVCAKMQAMKPDFDVLKMKAGSFLDRVSALDAECAKAGDAPPSDDFVKSFASLQDDGKALEAEGEALKAKAEQQAANAGGDLLVEAESAARFNVRTGVSDPMAREVNPSWRPPYSGSGSWYMGRGGDYLEYDITVPASGKYRLWIRDLASAIASQQGKRGVTISFDGKSVGTFPENVAGRSVPYPKGAFVWHEVATVDLTAGAHKMRVVKAASTNAAAILDAFYLSSTGKTPAER